MKGKTAAWSVTIPASATGWLPLSTNEAAAYKLEGVPLAQSKLAKAANGGFELAAGSYLFEVGL